MVNRSIRGQANVKVNLALHVVGQRIDGFHLLDSLVAFPEYGDELIVKNAKEISLSISGPFGDQLLNETKNLSNIVLRAAKLFEDKNNGAAIQLIKNIPIASGIGGGSSDAALTLKILSRLWKKKMPALTDIANLGSDIPVCLSNEFQRMQGIGDKVTILKPPPPMWIVLANPGIKVPTAKIFDFLNAKSNQGLEPLSSVYDHDSFFQYLKRQRNDLENVTCHLYPEVKELILAIKNTRNCKVCRMSGSGATCFGLYQQKTCAQMAEKIISESFVKYLDITPEVALTLAQEGFSSVDEIAYAPPKDMSEIDALDENIVEDIRSKARDYLLKQAINPESLDMDAEPSKALLEMEGMTNDLAFELACRGIITIDDLADQSIDELLPINNMTEELAGKLIMTARAPMFEGKN